MLIVACVMSGCSKSDSNPPQPPTGSVAIPTALLDLRARETLKEPLPAITSVEVLAESGLQVAYTQPEQADVVSALSVEANWLHMQSCLNQVGVAPLVLMRDAVVASLTLADQVVHSIDGVLAASASVGSIPVIQIGLSDFIGTGDQYAYNLRSIMGRLLWSSAGLSVRDYPYFCARQLVE